MRRVQVALRRVCSAALFDARSSVAPTAGSRPQQALQPHRLPHRRSRGDSAAVADSRTQLAAKKTYTVPAGTKVLLQLRSAINTKSARAGRRRLPGLDLSGRGGEPGHDSRRRLCAGRGRPGAARRPREGQGAARHALYLHHLSQRHSGGDSRSGEQPARRKSRT